MPPHLKHIVCAISGGVDSCVAALLLKQKGYHVQGVFMRNWDIADETGHCQADEDKEDAHYVCQKLGIPFLEVNFVKEYWNNVFSDMVAEYRSGFTPNPDILCNQRIKFDQLFRLAFEKLKADAVATGHYARLKESGVNDIRLLKGVDPNKDQTFFLSKVPRSALQKSVFPLGNMMKEEVKKIAYECGFEKIARKKESTGICFIGRRKFQNFINDYIEPKPGNFIDVESGQIVGHHKGVHCWTIGQRCMIPGMPLPYYVAEKNAESQEILVAPGRNHPSLFHQSVVTGSPYWIADGVPVEPKSKAFICDFRFQHREPLMKCIVYMNEDRSLQIFLEKPLKALTPGQYAVFYQGDECLGSAKIIARGPSLYAVSSVYPVFSDVVSYPEFYGKIKRNF